MMEYFSDMLIVYVAFFFGFIAVYLLVVTWGESDE